MGDFNTTLSGTGAYGAGASFTTMGQTNGSALASAGASPWRTVQSRDSKVLCADNRWRTPSQAERWTDRHPNWKKTSIGKVHEKKLTQEGLRQKAVSQIKRMQEAQKQVENAIQPEDHDAETSQAANNVPYLASFRKAGDQLRADSSKKTGERPHKTKKVSMRAMRPFERLGEGPDARFKVLKSPLLKENEVPRLIVVSDTDHTDPKVREELASLAKHIQQYDPLTRLLVENPDNGLTPTQGTGGHLCSVMKNKKLCSGIDLPDVNDRIRNDIITATEAFLSMAEKVHKHAIGSGLFSQDGINYLDPGAYADKVRRSFRSIKSIYNMYYQPAITILSTSQEVKSKIDPYRASYLEADEKFWRKVWDINDERNAHMVQRMHESISDEYLTMAVLGAQHVIDIVEDLISSERCWVLTQSKYEDEISKMSPFHQQEIKNRRSNKKQKDEL